MVFQSPPLPVRPQSSQIFPRSYAIGYSRSPYSTNHVWWLPSSGEPAESCVANIDLLVGVCVCVCVCVKRVSYDIMSSRLLS